MRSTSALAFLLAPAAALAQDFTPTAGPSGGTVSAFAATPTALFAGVGTVYRSDDHAASWRFAGTGLPSGVNIMSMASIGAEVYAGSRAHGLWRSLDGGSSWQLLPTNTPGLAITAIAGSANSIYLLASQPGNPNAQPVLVRSLDHGSTFSTVATPEPPLSLTLAGSTVIIGGMFAAYRSATQGDTWINTSIGSSGFPLVTAFASNSPTLLSFADFDQSMYRSTDNGVTWSPAAQGLNSNNLKAMTRAGANFYAVDPNQIPVRSYKSADGVAWTNLAPAMIAGGVDGLPRLMGGDASAVLLGTSSGLFRSTNAGTTWSPASNGIAATAISDLAANANAVFALVVNQPRVNRTTDGGVTWSAASLPTSLQTRAIAATSTTVFVGTDRGGVLRSTDGGLTYAASNSGITQYIGMAGTQYREIEAVASNGVYAFAGAGVSFERTGREPSGSQGPSITGGGLFRSINNGASWQPWNSGLQGMGTNLFGEPIWEPITAVAVLGSRVIVGQASYLTVPDDPFVGGAFIAGLSDTGFRRILDGGVGCGGFVPTFTSFVEAGGAVLASSLCTCNCNSSPGIARYEEEIGAWARSDFGIPPNAPVYSLSEHDGVVYAAVGVSASDPTSVAGVYASTDTGFTWHALGTAMAAVPASSMAVSGGRLYAGTNGLGVWSRGLPCTADFNNDGDSGTDRDIEAFFACLAGNCCATCNSADFNLDGDVGTDADIESFFRVLAGNAC